MNAEKTCGSLRAIASVRDRREDMLLSKTIVFLCKDKHDNLVLDLRQRTALWQDQDISWGIDAYRHLRPVCRQGSVQWPVSRADCRYHSKLSGLIFLHDPAYKCGEIY